MTLDILILTILYIYLFRSLTRYSREKALKYHEFFVIERITLASAFIFGVVNIYVATSVYIVALLVTSIAQYLLRKRYEFMEKK
jgi:hypothetical protein